MTDWSKWTRDVSSNYPLVYKEFDGKLQKDGKPRKYWIQDLTEEYIPEVVRNYTELFLGDEPLSKYIECLKDPVCTQEMGEMWKEILKKKFSLICLTKDDEENIKIAGFNSLYMMTKDEKKHEFKSPKTRKILGIIDYFTAKKDPFTEFGHDMFIGAMGLFVLPEFRGEGLGQVILDSRKLICKALGFKASLTAFTSPISQKQAARSGFTDYVVETYEDLAKIDKKYEIIGIQKESKLCRFMYIPY